MGGHAFSDNIKLSRLSNTEYHRIKTYVLELIKPYVLDAKVPQHILSKQDHGDLDILYVLNTEKISKTNFKNFLKENFKSLEVNTQAPPSVSYHFNVDNFENAQVDLIPAENIFHLQQMYFFMSHGDFGMILGHLCSCLGYNLSNFTLKVRVIYDNDSSKIVGNLELTSDYNEILEFLGYDYEIFKSKSTDVDDKLSTDFAFKNENEFFKYLASSSKMKAQFFSLNDSDKYNDHKKKKAVKRPVYSRFRDFIVNCENQKLRSDDDKLISINHETIDKEANKLDAINHFNKQTEHQNLQKNYEKTLNFKKKFNGNIIMDILPEFKNALNKSPKNGKILGKFCQNFKENFGEDGILLMGEGELEGEILKYFNENKGKFVFV